MRVSYSISYDTFVNQQPKFKATEPPSRGLLFFMQFAIVFSGIGFVLILAHIFSSLDQSPPPTTSVTKAICILAISALSLLGIWIARRISARRLESQHEEFLRDSYSRVHCRDHRFVDVSDEGLVFGCNCGQVSRPWSQFVTQLETQSNFLLYTRSEVLEIPKIAFLSEGDRTEFRSFLSRQLTQEKSLAAPAIEVACTRADWRRARWLRFRAGGWVRAAAFTATALFMAGLILYFVPFVEGHEQSSLAVITATCLFTLLSVITVLRFLRTPIPVWILLPIKIWVAADAIYMGSPIGEIRIPWVHLTNCLVDRRSVLFTEAGRSLILIPQRCISPAQRDQIMTQLRAKLGKNLKFYGNVGRE
jgi:hypothetical protein